MYYLLPLPVMCIVGILFLVARFYKYKMFEKVTLILFIVLTLIFILLYLHYNKVWIF